MPTIRPEPILLFGMPRSGTTWIGKVFDSHPDTVYRHEPDSVVSLAGLPLLMAGEPAPEQQWQLAAYTDAVRSMNHPKVVGKLPLFGKSYLSGARFGLYRAGVLASKLAARASVELRVLGTARAEAAYYSVYKDPAVAAGKWRDELDSAAIDRILAIARRGSAGRQFIECTAGA